VKALATTHQRQAEALLKRSELDDLAENPSFHVLAKCFTLLSVFTLKPFFFLIKTVFTLKGISRFTVIVFIFHGYCFHVSRLLFSRFSQAVLSFHVSRFWFSFITVVVFTFHG